MQHESPVFIRLETHHIIIDHDGNILTCFLSFLSIIITAEQSEFLTVKSHEVYISVETEIVLMADARHFQHYGDPGGIVVSAWRHLKQLPSLMVV